MSARTTDELLASNRELVDRLNKPRLKSFLSKVNKLGLSYVGRSLTALLVYETWGVQGLVYLCVSIGALIGLTILVAGRRMSARGWA